MGLASPGRAVVSTLAQVVAPTRVQVAGLIPAPVVAHTLDREVVPTPAQAVVLIPVLVAAHTPAQVVARTLAQAAELTLVPEDLVILALGVETLTDGTARLPTASKQGKRNVSTRRK